jgi:predicted DNA-binding protein (MmcQ/YjbR family)
MSPSHTPKHAEAELRAFALSYPDATEDFPWGERVAKVRGKVFAFIGVPDGELAVTVKLPHSNGMALMLPNVNPTGYGLGKSGWVSARFPPGDAPPLPMLCEWIDESYRAIAPKRLVATLPPAGAAPIAGAKPAPARRKGGGKKTAKRVAR